MSRTRKCQPLGSVLKLFVCYVICMILRFNFITCHNLLVTKEFRFIGYAFREGNVYFCKHFIACIISDYVFGVY
jgi:hypothetical protein